MKKTIITIVITLTALLATCSVSFASQAAVDSNTYRHPSKFDNCMVIDGVDVSYWQYDIDWGKVKRRGIDYAFIRIGYTGLDSPFSMNRDSYFEQNYKAARDAGVMVGVYYYSCATTLDEAKKEAKYVLDILGDRELDLPVVFDYEFAGRIVNAYNSWTSNTRREKMTSNALAFLNYIQKNSNYEAMFYSYRNMLDETFSSNYKFNTSLIDSKYKVWMAQYSTDNSYYRPFEFWQYTSSGSIAGISGSADCNFWYYDNNSEVTKPGTKSIKDASITLGAKSYNYNMYQKKPSVKVSYNGTTLTKDTDYKVYYIKNALAGTGYAWVKGIGNYSNSKMVPFTINTVDIADGGVIADIPEKTYTGAVQKPAIKFTYKNTSFKKDIDYTISYGENKNAGTGSVTVTGKRNFYGSITKTFKINKANPTFSGYTGYTRTPSRDPWKINTKSTSDAALSYKSSDTSIAKVDADGKVTLTGGIGIAYITVTSPATKNYNAATKEVRITVNPEETKLTVPTITTTEESYSKKIGDGGFDLGAKSDSDGKITFSSDNTAVATVNAKGAVTLSGKAGTAVITIKTAATEKFSAGEKKVTVTVGSNNIVTGVKNTTIDASAVLGDKFITVKWKKSAGYKMDCFEIYRSEKSDSGYGDVPIYTTKSGTSASVKNAKNLTDGKTYYYKIRGVRMIDGVTYYSKWSNVASMKYQNPSAGPSQKLIDGVENTTLTATSSASPGYITVKWVKSYGYKMDYYEVYRSTKSNVYDSKPFFKTLDGTKTSYKNNKSLTAGTKYFYRVRGVRVLNGKPYYTKWSSQAIRVAK